MDANATLKIQVIMIILMVMKSRILKGDAKLEACSSWEYDKSEFYDTAITENDWVCAKVKQSIKHLNKK